MEGWIGTEQVISGGQPRDWTGAEDKWAKPLATLTRQQNRWDEPFRRLNRHQDRWVKSFWRAIWRPMTQVGLL